MERLSELIGELSIDEAVEYGTQLVKDGISFQDYQQRIIYMEILIFLNKLKS